MKQRQAPIELPIINRQRCTGCGICEQSCPTAAVEVRDGYAVIVRPEDCTYCDICESYCPEGAIGRPFTVIFASDQAHPTGSAQA